MNTSILTRSLVVTSALLLCGFALDRSSRTEPVAIRAPLSDLPMQLGGWRGARAADLEPEVLKVLGVDDWINRVYFANAAPGIGLYIGYYQTQRQGSAMHSPLNCLPGSGWQPVTNRRANITVAGNAPIEVNRYVVQKSGESMLVLYWYQSHGRVIASEYWGKIYMVTDAIRLNRTDAALVRVIVPIVGSDPAAEDRAEQFGVDFVQKMFPALSRHLPV